MTEENNTTNEGNYLQITNEATNTLLKGMGAKEIDVYNTELASLDTSVAHSIEFAMENFPKIVNLMDEIATNSKYRRDLAMDYAKEKGIEQEAADGTYEEEGKAAELIGEIALQGIRVGRNKQVLSLAMEEAKRTGHFDVETLAKNLAFNLEEDMKKAQDEVGLEEFGSQSTEEEVTTLATQSLFYGALVQGGYAPNATTAEGLDNSAKMLVAIASVYDSQLGEYTNKLNQKARNTVKAQFGEVIAAAEKSDNDEEAMKNLEMLVGQSQKLSATIHGAKVIEQSENNFEALRNYKPISEEANKYIAAAEKRAENVSVRLIEADSAEESHAQE